MISKRSPGRSKRLRECYEQGAEKFGWSKRNSQPGSMRGAKRSSARLGNGDRCLSR